MREKWGRTKCLEFLKSPNPDWSRISDIFISGGFHGGLRLDLAPGLNAVIGGKGTGKSTLLEIVRYLAEAPESIAEDQIGRMGTSNRSANFPANAEALMGYVTDDGQSYEIHRVGESLRSTLKAEGQQLDLGVSRRVRVSVYGQRELAELHKNPRILLEFIARCAPEETESADRAIRALMSEIEVLEHNIGGIESRFTRSEEDSAELQDLDERLARYQRAGVEELLVRAAQLASADSSVTAYENWLIEVRLRLTSLSQELPPPMSDESPISVAIRNHKDEVEGKFIAAIGGIGKVIEEAEATLRTLKAADWAPAYEQLRCDCPRGHHGGCVGVRRGAAFTQVRAERGASQ